MIQRKECAHVSRPTIPTTPSFSDSTDRCSNPYQKKPPPLYLLRKTKFETIKPVKAQNKNQSREHQATKLGKVPEEECTYSDNATKHECARLSNLDPSPFPGQTNKRILIKNTATQTIGCCQPKNFPKRPGQSKARGTRTFLTNSTGLLLLQRIRSSIGAATASKDAQRRETKIEEEKRKRHKAGA